MGSSCSKEHLSHAMASDTHDSFLQLHPIDQRRRPVSSLAPDSGLLGKDASEAALVDQWVHFGETEIATFSYEILALVAGYLGPYNKEVRGTTSTSNAAA